MVIDILFDRRDGYGYDPKHLYNYCMASPMLDVVEPIRKALDYGTEADVKQALLDYCSQNGYVHGGMPEYIRSVKWLESEPMSDVGRWSRTL